MSSNISEKQTTYNIYIDNKKIDNLLIQNISQDDYYNLVINNQILSNTLYIISSDAVNMYNEQIKHVADGTDLLDAINLNQLCVAISSINENVFSLSTTGVPSVQVKKVSDLCSTTNINDQDLLLVVNENNSKNITIKDLRKSIISPMFSDYTHEQLGCLAFKNYFYINDLSGKIPSDYIENLSALAFKNKITSDDISGKIQKNKIIDFDTSDIKFLSGYTTKLVSGILSNGDTLNVALGKLQKQISTISANMPNDIDIELSCQFLKDDNNIKIASININGTCTDLYIPETKYALVPNWKNNNIMQISDGQKLSSYGFIKFESCTTSNNISSTGKAYINNICVACFQQKYSDNIDTYDVQTSIVQASIDDVINFDDDISASFIPAKYIRL